MPSGCRGEEEGVSRGRGRERGKKREGFGFFYRMSPFSMSPHVRRRSYFLLLFQVHSRASLGTAIGGRWPLPVRLSGNTLDLVRRDPLWDLTLSLVILVVWTDLTPKLGPFFSSILYSLFFILFRQGQPKDRTLIMYPQSPDRAY